MFRRISLLFSFWLAVVSCVPARMLWHKESDVAGSDTVDDTTGETGTLDLTFNSVGYSLISLSGVDLVATCLAIQPDGKILIGGYSKATTGSFDDFLLIRLSATGAVDSAFGGSAQGIVRTDAARLIYTASSFADRAEAIVVDTAGRILLAGTSAIGATIQDQFIVARFSNSGGIDTQFNTVGAIDVGWGSAGGTEFDRAHAMALMPSDKVLVLGESKDSSSYDFAATALTSSGGLDPTFNGSTGKQRYSGSGSFEEEGGNAAIYSSSQSKLYLVGYKYGSSVVGRNFSVWRIGTDSVADGSFGASGASSFAFDLGGSKHDEAKAAVVHTDGSVTAAGFAETTSGHDFALGRLNSHGYLESGFGVNGKVTTSLPSGEGKILGLAEDSNQRLIAAGSSSGANVALARYDSAGTLDPSFGGSGMRIKSFCEGEDYAAAIGIQSDGKILIAGPCTEHGITKVLVARFNP